jgi:AraC-like DNA-binding protein
MNKVFDTILSQALRFEYQSGNVTPLRKPHTTGWRTLPGLMCSQAHANGSECIHLTDGRTLTARPGELIVLPAGVYHKVDVLSPREVRRWVHVNYFVFDSLDLFSLFDIDVLVNRKLGMRIGDLIEEWIEVHSKASLHESLWLNARCHQFGFELLAALAQVSKPKPGIGERWAHARELWPVIQYMHANFEKPIERDTLAELACLSPAQFHHVFKQTTGATPIDYLRSIRIRHAQQLLITSAQSVYEIARHCGYEDPFVFSKAFKRVCNTSPREYRATIQRSES